MQPRQGALAGAADAAEVVELALERIGGALVALARSGILGLGGALRELCRAGCQILFHRRRGRARQRSGALGDVERGQGERIEQAAQFKARAGRKLVRSATPGGHGPFGERAQVRTERGSQRGEPRFDGIAADGHVQRHRRKAGPETERRTRGAGRDPARQQPGESSRQR